ncbi:MAG: carbamate kinase [Planctomycetaceae bacterium]|nr:carbamate kinase [Planctomycetaceae bacterium]
MADNKLAVIAIGGNSLIVDNKPALPDQYKAVVATVKHIVDVIEQGWRVLVTHGNGPQVGYLLLRSEMALRHAGLHPLPLLNCVADTQGNNGFMIQQALGNELRRRGLADKTATIVTQVEIDPNDPKFQDPDKFVGGFYSAEEVEKIRVENPTWIMKEDSNRGYRRVVPSPKPVKIIEMEALRIMLDNGYNVVVGGGGGIPVIWSGDGYLGVDAVIDKDLTSRLIANSLGADLFVISTGVDTVSINFGTPQQEALTMVDVDTLQKHMDDGQFPKGSMGPKIQAASDFIRQGGKEVIITSPDNLGKAICEGAGTHIVARK